MLLVRRDVFGDTVAAWLTRTARTESYGAGLRSAREVIMAPCTPAITASASTRAAAQPGDLHQGRDVLRHPRAARTPRQQPHPADAAPGLRAQDPSHADTAAVSSG